MPESEQGASMTAGVPSRSHDAPVLDPAQLKRIESTHRGFLYQHLFAVGALLLAQKGRVTMVAVERDEDIELVIPDATVYLQVKTRTYDLQRHDIDSALETFSALRVAHNSGVRVGMAVFYIISNAPPGPHLLAQYRDENWPTDVHLVWPGNAEPQPEWIPPAWPTIADAIDWCVGKANSVPFGSISGSTLVWKLAAVVQHACTGASNHCFATEGLPTLFEQVTIQLHSFPEIPTPYIAHSEEPPYAVDAHVRLIVGHSGSGKTAWASVAALHVETDSAYFDVGDTPSAAVPASLTRELVGRLFDQGGFHRSHILLPGNSGLDSFRALNAALHETNRRVTVFLDNAHRIPASDIATLVSVTTHIDWVLLAQACPNQIVSESLLSISSEHLQGWSPEAIAARSRDEGCPIDYAVAQRLRGLTQGLPLFVRSTIALAKSAYASDLAVCCADLATASHTSITSQEAILARVRTSLSDQARTCMALLSISDVPFSGEEVKSIIARAMAIEKPTVARILRELGAWSVIQVWRAGQIILHDAFRILANEDLHCLPKEILLTAKRAAKDCLIAAPDPLRLTFLLRLLPEIGETETLLDIATNVSEQLKELGVVPQIASIIRAYADDPSTSKRDRFWALDALALWASEALDLTELKSLTNEMETLYGTGNLGPKERCELATKRMLLFGHNGDGDAALQEFRAVEDSVKANPVNNRILRYDCAVALFHAGKYAQAVRLIAELSKEYFAVLGLTPADVTFKNPPEIWKALNEDDAKLEPLKRLADCLDVHAMAMGRLGQRSGFARIHAHKFFVMTSAYRSAVRVGQDFVDEMLRYGAGPDEARRFMEDSLLPMVRDLRLLEYIVPVRAQYAVLLAYCGETRAAQQEMQALAAFEIQDPIRKKELEQQAALVEGIANGTISNPHGRKLLAKPSTVAPIRLPTGRRPPSGKVGRNSPCPCGSGKKFKRCCMREC
jgi:hypothetical protein